ncbi:hypothetical protein Tco_1569288 [Tanacetum coccineum]
MDYKRTQEYLPRIHRTRRMDEDLKESYHTLEKRLFHEGRLVTPSFIEANNMLHPFKPLKVKRDEEERLYIEFKLGQFTFKLTSSQLSRVLQTLYALDTFYTSEWSLNSIDDHPNNISRKPSEENGKKISSPSVTSSSSSSSNDNEAPSFIEFYDELSTLRILTKATEKRGCLNA